MKYNSIGEQLIAKAKELDPNYKPDKFNDMSEAIDILLNNSGGGSDDGGDIWLDITPYLNEDMTSISQEGFDLVWNSFFIEVENPSNKYAGILFMVYKMIFNGIVVISDDKMGLNFIVNLDDHGEKCHLRASIYNDKSVEMINEDEAASSNIPALPSDASTKTYTLQAVNGVLTWTDAIGDINSILDNINGEVI